MLNYVALTPGPATVKLQNVYAYSTVRQSFTIVNWSSIKSWRNAKHNNYVEFQCTQAYLSDPAIDLMKNRQ